MTSPLQRLRRRARASGHGWGALLILLTFPLIGSGCASTGVSREEAMLREQSPVVLRADAAGAAGAPGEPPEREGYTCPICRF